MSSAIDAPSSSASDAQDGQFNAGWIMACASYAIWGAMPVLLWMLRPASPSLVLAHRVLWSAGMLGLVVLLTGRLRRLANIVRDWRTMGTLVCSSALIGTNWLIFIQAVHNGQVLEASMGAYLIPVASVLIGTVVFGEPIRPMERAAVACASVGIVVLAAGQGSSLVWALSLTFTFCAYGAVRKAVRVDPLTGLFVETVAISPIAIAWLVYSHGLALQQPTPVYSLLIVSAAMIALPMFLFNAATQRLSFAMLGLLQYINPTVQFMVAVFYFGEAVRSLQLVAFAFIWFGVGAYVIATLNSRKTPVTGQTKMTTRPIM